LAFNLFRKTKAKDVIVGKNNYLYEKNYIKAYNGSDFIGSDSILDRMQKLGFIQDTLSKLGTDIILVFAPGKGSYYPEFIPDRFLKSTGPTNLESHLKYAKELGLNFIDFNSYFRSNKNTSAYPLYPKYGIHWSFYGACLVTDSIIKYIEANRNINMPDIMWDQIEIDTAKNGDNDIAEGMNLLFEFEPEMLAYPSVHFDPGEGKVKPSVLVISDSFFWIIYNTDVKKVFSSLHFWFYNREIYPDHFISPKFTSDVNVVYEIINHDVIIIMAGDATLTDLGWGFIKTAYDLLKGNLINNRFTDEFLQKISAMREGIKNDSAWLKAIEVKALERNIPLDSMLTLDAIWILQH